MVARLQFPGGARLFDDFASAAVDPHPKHCTCDVARLVCWRDVTDGSRLVVGLADAL